METDKKTNVQESETTSDEHMPRKLTLAQNVILTAKVLLCSALILGALWGVNQWTAGK